MMEEEPEWEAAVASALPAVTLEVELLDGAAMAVEEDSAEDSATVALLEAEAVADSVPLPEKDSWTRSMAGRSLEEYHGRLVTVAVKAETSSSVNKEV